MRSEVAKRLMAKTPSHVNVFVDKYTDMIVRINTLIKEKGLTQKELAKNMGKSPSEISKWLSGDHNLTLRTIAKLEAELGESILVVPKTHMFHSIGSASLQMSVQGGYQPSVKSDFVNGNPQKASQNNPLKTEQMSPKVA